MVHASGLKRGEERRELELLFLSIINRSNIKLTQEHCSALYVC